MKAWRIEKQTYGSCEKESKVYTDKAVAKLIADSKHEEFTMHVAVEVEIRMLNETEAAIDKEKVLVRVDNTTEDEYHRQRGLAKLSTQEKKALGLTCLLALLVLVGCNERVPVPTKTHQFTEIDVIEMGTINRQEYVMFKDRRTGVRIFHYYQSMVVLPPEQAESTKMR